MAIFLGAVLKKSNSERVEQWRRIFSHVLQEKTHSSIVKTGSDFWVVCAAKRNHETDQEQVVVLPNRSGIAIGRFYSKLTYAPLDVEDNKSVAEISKGRLPDNYWGRYIFLHADEFKKDIKIYRDPTGLSKLFFITLEQGLFFSSDLALLVEIAKDTQRNPTIDWEYFCSYLSCGVMNTAQTPFQGIRELQSGCCLNYRQEKLSISVFWDPTLIKKTGTEDALISTFNSSARAWIQDSPRPCLQLSGGLDSTALFLSMNQFKKYPDYSLINYLSQHVASSNESLYVNKLLDKTEAKPIYHEWQYTVDPAKKEKWDRPHANIMDIDNRIALLEKLGTAPIELINGHGGDHLFLARVTPSCLTDYLLQKGPKGCIEIMRNIGLINREPLLPYCGAILKDIIRSLFKVERKTNTAFLLLNGDWFKKELNDQINLNIYRPPYWQSLFNVSPGKADHMMSTYHASAFANFESPGITELFPYLSQPLVELGLSVHTYQTFNDRWTRLHFRRAISNYFQSDDVWRQSKGEVSGVVQLCIKKNIKRVEALCLEGRFSQEKLIDRDLLKKHIAPFANGQMEKLWLIMHLISAELWFEAWSC